MKALIAGQNDQLAALRQQVANLGGAGADPVALQDVLNQFDAANTANEAAQADLAAAVTQNTEITLPGTGTLEPGQTTGPVGGAVQSITGGTGVDAGSGS